MQLSVASERVTSSPSNGPFSLKGSISTQPFLLPPLSQAKGPLSMNTRMSPIGTPKLRMTGERRVAKFSPAVRGGHQSLFVLGLNH